MSPLIRFIRDVRAEVNRITWPSGQETRRLTLMVGILASVIALFLVAVDMLIGSGLSYVFGVNF